MVKYRSGVLIRNPGLRRNDGRKGPKEKSHG